MTFRGSSCQLGCMLIGLGSLLLMSGCYYMQAARGQLELMHKREPIVDVINADDTPAELSTRLQLAQEARRFSVETLHLPDNDSYRLYADLERNYVVWNVFAAPEFSLQPMSWCFPVAGCVNYRGYFSEAKARSKAQRYEDDGLDVAVGGIAAYSTLGKFSDPILNTMMRWQDTDLVAMMFHELAHQKLYVKNDSAFNESFATAVEQFGIERWLSSRDEMHELTRYEDRRESRERLMQYVSQARDDLEDIYSSSLAEHDMRAAKQRRLQQLQRDLRSEIDGTGRATPGWMHEELNNGRLASMILYEDRLPEFRALLADCNEDVLCFYAAAEKLAKQR